MKEEVRGDFYRDYQAEVEALLSLQICGLLYFNSEGVILDINTNLMERLGYSRTSIGDTIYELLEETSIPLFSERITEAKQFDQTKIFELSFRRNTFATIKFVAQLYYISKRSSPYFLLKVNQDYDIQPVDKKRDDFDSLFKSISRNLSEGIFRFSWEKGLAFINTAFVDLFEKDYTTLVGTSFMELLAEEEHDIKGFKEKLLLNGSVENEIIKFRKNEDQVFYGLINCTKVVEENGAVYFDGAIVDITEKVEADKLLKQKNQELQKINNQMDRFLYSASHDIRAPLTSVLGLVNLLRLEVSEEDLHGYLDKIEHSIGKLDQFVSDIKDFSQNARQKLDSQRINFSTLIDSLWKKFKYIHKEIDLYAEVNNGRIFYSDKNRINLILENIVKNSIAFSDIHKKERFIKIKVHLLQDKAIIEIIDNGIGIPKAHISKVHNMFYRASESSKGSGLGLYIVNETLLKLGGAMNLESEVNMGTIVTVEIPNDEKGKLITRKYELSLGKVLK